MYPPDSTGKVRYYASRSRFQVHGMIGSEKRRDWSPLFCRQDGSVTCSYARIAKTVIIPAAVVRFMSGIIISATEFFGG